MKKIKVCKNNTVGFLAVGAVCIALVFSYPSSAGYNNCWDLCDTGLQMCQGRALVNEVLCEDRCIPSGDPPCVSECEDDYVQDAWLCTVVWVACNANCDLQTPVVLDLDRNNFHFSGPDDPVEFDLDADGTADVITWTQSGQRDAFLCLDRNQNGWIDDGAELFGNFTPSILDGSTGANGYDVLAEFDLAEFGGNGDGFVDASDGIYRDLTVWIDSNHNGLSEAEELSSLASAGVERIGLSYRERGRVDQHGNQLRYMGDAWITIDDQSKHTATVDVSFQDVN